MAERVEFAEFECNEIGIRIGDDASATVANCLASIEYTVEIKTVTKNCGGSAAKVKSRTTGHGTMKITGQVPYVVYEKMRGLDATGLKPGVRGNKKGTILPEECITAKVENEDGEVKLYAFPKATITADTTTTITNGSDTIADLEIEMEYFPDANKMGFYECLEEDLPDSVSVETWMESFQATMVTA